MKAKWQNKYDYNGFNYQTTMLVYRVGFVTLIFVKERQFANIRNGYCEKLSITFVRDNGYFTGYEIETSGFDDEYDPPYEFFGSRHCLEIKEYILTEDNLPNTLINWLECQIDCSELKYPTIHEIGFDPTHKCYSSDNPYYREPEDYSDDELTYAHSWDIGFDPVLELLSRRN